MSRRTGRMVETADTAGSGYGDVAAVVPLAAGAVAIWFVSEAQSFLLLSLSLFWGGAILIFFGGARRGAAMGRSDANGSLAVAIWLFATGFAGLIGTVWAYPMLATAAEIVGYASLLLLGSASGTRTAEGRRHSGRSNPAAAVLAILSLIAVAAFVYVSPLV